MAEVAVDVAMESTSQEILNLLKVVKTMVTDVSKFDWKNFYQQTATDEVFSTKFYYYETSTSPKGERMNASIGLTSVPSTETIKGQDDFSNRSAFQTLDCNFVIDENENKTPVAIKDGNGYSNIGKVDVGVMVPLTYWGIQKFDTYYIVHFATRPHPELECTTVTPWCNEELGYGILTKYYAGQIDGILYSSSGNPIFNFVSAQSGNAYMRNIADKVKIAKIETISGTSNSKVYVEKAGMTITADTYVSSMPLHSGTTDNVLGSDGYVVNDNKHAFKLGGIEDMVGAYFISMDELWNKTTASTVDYYVRGKSAWSATASGWIKVATVDLGGSDDYWIGDIEIDLNTGAAWLKTKGSGDSVGTGDRQYNGGTGTGWREALRRGNLGFGSVAGLSCAPLGYDVSGAGWGCALCV